MRIVALMIGRGGSSLKNKNILPVLGHPLLHWSAAAARRSKHITEFFISSDDDLILQVGAEAGYEPINRPAELSGATARSSDAVRHALDLIEHDAPPVDVLVVQHANVGTITEHMIDDCIHLLLQSPGLSSVVPSHEHQEYHPMRAKMVLPDGTLQSFFPGPISPNRQELPTAVFFDHSFWVLRGRAAVFDPNGQEPWPCMGSKILPFMTQGCLDVHSIEDYERTAEWIIEHGLLEPTFAQT